MSSFSRFLQRIDWPNHLMVFISTLLGVWLAISWGNYNDYRRDRNRMQVAMANVRQEIVKNEQRTEEHSAHLDSLLTAIKAFSKLIDEDLKLVTSENQMAEFQKEYDWFLVIQDKRPLRDSLFEYDGSLNLNLRYSNLSEIAWENTKLMDVLHLIDTETAFQLHGVYRLQTEAQRTIDEAIDILKNLFQSNNDSDAVTRKIINELKGQLQFARGMEQALLMNYKEILKRMPG